MKYLSLNNLKLQQFIALWNDEFEDILYIDEAYFKERVMNCRHLFMKGSFVAYNVNDEFVGLIICKTSSDQGYISMIYVNEKYRLQHIGRTLVRKALEAFENETIVNVTVGKGPNAFLIGLPNLDKMQPVINFFKHNGFNFTHESYDLVVKKNISFRPIQGFHFRCATINDKDDLLEFIKENFSIDWYHIAYQYFNNGHNGSHYAIALDENQTIVAFCMITEKYRYPKDHFKDDFIDQIKKGGAGPLGVAQYMRGKGLGRAIVEYAISLLQNKNCQKIYIDWTGLKSFYEKIGAETLYIYHHFSRKLQK